MSGSIDQTHNDDPSGDTHDEGTEAPPGVAESVEDIEVVPLDEPADDDQVPNQ